MKNQVNLRKFPYPYQAMFAVCSDIDRCTKDNFISLHDFLNTDSSDTKFGKGLGLDISDSFWMFNENPYEKDQIAYFDDTVAYKNAHKKLILEYYNKGVLDVLHTYGDFSFHPVFTRKLAEKTFAEFEKEGIRVKVWVNHGTVHNMQNLTSGCGDSKSYKDGSGKEWGFPEYHSDLLRKNGIIFAWIDELTHVIGQDRPCSLKEFFLSNKDLPKSRRAVHLAAALAARPFVKNSLVKRKIKALMGKTFAAGLSDNNLLTPVQLKDGQWIYSFKRYGNHELASSDDIACLLHEGVFQELIKKQGFMIYYTHMGKILNEKKAIIKMKETFGMLKNKMDEEKILVCRTSDLLVYNLISTRLLWNYDNGTITITGVKDELGGGFKPEKRDYSGLTFYTKDPLNTKIVMKTKKGDNEIKNVQINPADSSGVPSISIPWPKAIQ